MKLARWSKIDSLFEQALELPEGEVEAFLQQHCAGDPQGQQKVRDLLRAEVDSQGFLETPVEMPLWMNQGMLEVVGGPGDGAASESVSEESSGELGRLEPGQTELGATKTGETLGSYRILRQVDGGGMADVFLAERDDDSYHRQVAIKRMREGFAGRGLQHRFQREREILARLEHPGIARLYDGGTDAAGRPYLVMEFIDGLRIDAYCDRQELTIEQRLDLFSELCGAVQFAHRNLLVHRDLKPSNILVTVEGEVKLIDFGIAKQIDAADDLTRAMEAPMSLAYASPEQVRGEEISTASDVFSLGVVLYELLSGSRPFGADQPMLAHELARLVCEDSPSSMSSALLRQREGKGAARSAQRRGVGVGELRRRLTGDLESIVSKALEKDPARRYASVEALAADLQRYRSNRPVSARNKGAIYQSLKFARRHRIGVAAAACFIALASAFLFSQVSQAQRMERERDKVTRAMDFLVDIFAVSSPGAPLGDAVPARQVLDQAARRADQELRGEPDVQATLLDTLGRVYRNLGLVDTAEDLLRRSLEIRRTGAGGRGGNRVETTDALAHTLHHLATTVTLRSGNEEALALFDEALAIRMRAHGADDPRVAESRLAKAEWLAHTQRWEEAETLTRQAVEVYSHHPNLILERARGQALLSSILQRVGKDEEARFQAEQALAARQEIYGVDHPLIADSLENLGGVLRNEGALEESVQLMRQALSMRRRISAPTDTNLLINLHNLALSLGELGEHQESEALLLEELEQLEIMFPGADHLGKASALFNLSVVTTRTGRQEKALELARQDLEMRRRLFGDRHPRTAPSWLNVGRHQRLMGDLGNAEENLRFALAVFQETRRPDQPGRSIPKYELGAILVAQGRLAEAEVLQREALAELRNLVPNTDIRVAFASHYLGACLAAQDRFQEAEPLLLASFETFRSRGEAVPGLDQTRREILSLYEAWGFPEKAAPFR